MSTHKHAYQRLSDDAVFCRDCGDIKRSEPPVCTLPHYPEMPYIPYVPPIVYPIWIQPWSPSTVPWWTITSVMADTVTFDSEPMPMLSGGTVTYTND